MVQRPPPDDRATKADRETHLVKISELARMSDVPTATIKHYIREGLLPGPAARTSRNMGYYDARLCHRVRTIKELQQERFLPLKFIAEVLEPAPSSAVRTDLDDIQRRQLGLADPPPGVAKHDKSGRRRRGGRAGIGRTRARVLETMRVEAHELDMLAEMELVEPVRSSAGADVYQGPDFELIEAIHESRERGLGELFPPEILASYAEAVGALVVTELELFRRRVLGGAKLPSGSPGHIAADASQVSGRLIAALRAKLLARELGALAEPPPHEDDPPG